MKNRFSTLDVFAAVHDLKALQGLRVTNVYDIDSKTYLIRLHVADEKCFIMLESGMRLHKSSFDWPKAQFPSSFSMKLRKHIKQKRFEKVEQLGVDRIVDMQFGSEDRAAHVIVELYDRGNIVLTDHQYTILNVLRPRTDKDTDVRFAVRETYPIGNARQEVVVPSKEQLAEMLGRAKKSESLKRALAPSTQYGPALVEHSLRSIGIASNSQIGIHISATEEDVQKLSVAMDIAQKVFDEIREKRSRGFIVYKLDTRADGVSLESYQEFHPYRFKQCESENLREFESFSECVDEYFSKIELQKADQRALNAEREAFKKLENVKRDQQERIESLELAQAEKREMAELIELNSELVDRALLVIRSAIANQAFAYLSFLDTLFGLSWEMIEEMRKKACESGDPVASAIVGLNLNSNEMLLSLRDPYRDDSPPKKVPIDIALSAYQNSRKFHSEKKAAIDKKQKTISASAKALKSAQLKTKETLATVRARADVVKSRRQMWFEKFFWFVSSENYLVIGGRDAQQNELLVKRYLRTGDVYVHADVRGASSVVIRNKVHGGEIPPKTLNEAGCMAVSRTAPTGEYLTPGSFMIRGKKNFLPSCQLQMGFGLMFKLDEDSLEQHRGERKVVAALMEDSGSVSVNNPDELELEEEIELEASGSEDEEEEAIAVPPETDEQFPDVSLSGIVNVGGAAGEGDEEYSIIQLGPTLGRTRTENERAREQFVEESKKKKEATKKANRPMTIRQKHKVQKIKKKYGDQDEEERRLRAEWLGSKDRASKRQGDGEVKEELGRGEAIRAKELRHQNLALDADDREQVKPKEKNGENILRPSAKVKDEEEDVDESDLRIMGEEETKMLDSLTWKPLSGDNLLYAVVVVAPYHTMLNFKYKVKLTPGTGKRGKAAKSAIALFQREKSASLQEVNLLRVLAVDDQIARNIPGKVRVSAPQLNKK
ncbi:Nuclear export mediator factor NEMF -like protein [Toxocara canis]|uniref:Nuclear export mediator factor NEMF-like protein n=1 Tax=Toxocara canis TaxID=6265 RepID=A0A0B2VUT9_TOXCA|nr:Nuclear export mediator factor NEMF -like protein [Toxocara canis]